jgi:hypothetical protein
MVAKSVAEPRGRARESFCRPPNAGHTKACNCDDCRSEVEDSSPTAAEGRIDLNQDFSDALRRALQGGHTRPRC